VFLNLRAYSQKPLAALKYRLYLFRKPRPLIYPVPNKWGKFGWTLVNLKTIDQEMLMEVLTAAYCTVAPPKLAEPYLKQIESF
jgi:hypothetical protein